MKREVEAWRKWPLPNTNDEESRFLDPLSVFQKTRCAMCGYSDYDGLVRDHCHVTGLVRGLLCRACNSQEGHAGMGGAWDAWRAGDNPAFALKHFEIYVSTFGRGTPITPNGNLHWYSHAEKAAWFKQIVIDLESGAPWPEDAPWTDAAEARRAHDIAEMHRIFENWDLFGTKASAIDGEAAS